MCTLKKLEINTFLWLLANIIIWLTLLADQVNGKPQDIFADIAKGTLMAIQQGAEIMRNGGVISKDHVVEMPFGKARSQTEIGGGEAMLQRHRQEFDSSEEDESKRRKRSLEDIVDNLIGEESLLPLPHNHMHHILKRSPCHGTTGTGGTNTGTGTLPGDGADVIDVVERRRRARMRKAEADKKKRSSKNSTRNGKKSKLISNDEPALTRRKRQTEQDDLTANLTKDFSQQAQQFAEKIRGIWDGIFNSMNQVAQSIKQKFTKNNPSETEEI